MTYEQQAARLDWRRYDAYAADWRDGDGATIAAIASRFGVTPCAVRRLLADGDRLSAWRPK